MVKKVGWVGGVGERWLWCVVLEVNCLGSRWPGLEGFESEFLYLFLLQDEAFNRKQTDELETEIKHILTDQKEEKKMLELNFLDAKQDLERSE